MENVSTRLAQVDEQVSRALTEVEGDAAASVVLQAVVKQFGQKFTETLSQVTGADEKTVRERIVELAQAGQSAKVAAEADPGITAETRRAVLEAQSGIAELREKL